jgi:hypothetical protein
LIRHEKIYCFLPAKCRYWPGASLIATRWFGRFREISGHGADTANWALLTQSAQTAAYFAAMRSTVPDPQPRLTCCRPDQSVTGPNVRVRPVLPLISAMPPLK